MKEVLSDILIGGHGAARAVLHNCRFEGAGSSAYGREAVLELFRAKKTVLQDLQAVRNGRFAAIFGLSESGSVALFADLYGEYIARLWYLAAVPLASPRGEHVDVPFDPTFGELAPSVGFDAADHPELASDHAPWAAAAAARLLDAGPAEDAISPRSGARLSRPRPFVLRAFSEGATAAVLMRMAALRGDGRPGLVQIPIAMCLPSNRPAEATVVIDEAECDAELSRDWRPLL